MNEQNDIHPIAEAISKFYQQQFDRKIKMSTIVATLSKPNFMDKYFETISSKLPVVTTPVRLCCKPFSFYFYCRTCCKDQDTGVCQECFRKELHQGHNYIKLKYNGQYCDCGMSDRWDSKPFCKSHGNYSPTILSKQDEELFANFLHHVFDLYELYKKHTPVNDKNFCSIMKNLKNFLLKFNKCSNFYIDITARELNERQIKQLAIGQTDVACDFSDLFLHLANSDLFLEKFMECIMKNVQNVKAMKAKKNLHSFFEKFQDTLRILNKLADRDLLLYESTPKDCIGFYTQIYKNTTSNRKGACGLLLPVWRCMLRKNVIDHENINRKHYAEIINDCITDTVSFSEFTKNLLEIVVRNKEEKAKYFMSYLLNKVFEDILAHLAADEEKIPDFFKNELKIKEQTVALLCKFYLNEVISQKHYSHFNLYSMEALMRIADAYHIPLHIFCRESWQKIGKDLTHRQATDIVSTFITKVMLQPQKKLAYLHQVAKRHKNHEKARFYEKELQKWFYQYLYTSNQVDRTRMIELRDRKVLSFPSAKKIIQNCTVFDEERYCFRYTGPEQKTSSDHILKSKEFYGLHFMEEDGMFSTPERRQIFSILTDGLYQELNKRKYSENFVYENHYSICAKAVVMDKILLGKDRQLRKMVLDLKDHTEKLKKPMSNIDNIFGIIRKEEPMKKIQVSTESSPPKTEKIQESHQVAKIQINEKKEQKEQVKVIIQKKEEAKEVKEKKEQVVKTKAQLAKEKKIAQMKEKYSKMARTHLEKILPEAKKEEISCLICKESTSTFQNPLFFCGSTKEDRFSKIFCRNFHVIGDNFMSFCLHPIHVVCFEKSNNRYRRQTKCPLCSHKSNLLLPIIESLEGKSVDFIRAIVENLCLQLEKSQNKKISVSELLILFLKNLINKNGVSQLWMASTEREEVKEEYCIGLIKLFSKVLNHKEQKHIRDQFEKLIQETLRSERRPIFADIEAVIARLIYEKYVELGLRNVTCQIAEQTIAKISKKDFKIVEKAVANIYRLMGREVGLKAELEISDAERFDQFLQEIDLPEDASGLFRMRSECQKCHLISTISCIQCRRLYCQKCDGYQHNQKHKEEGYFYVDLSNGFLKQCNRNGGIVKSYGLYEDIFREAFYPECCEPREYQLNKRKYMKAIVAFLKN